jgi:hypothetical protein
VEVQLLGADILLISDLNLFLSELLKQIPQAADPEGSEQAASRMFSDPASREEEAFLEDWRDYVKPELEELFAGALDVVRADLARMESYDQEGDQRFRVAIPMAHADQWLNGLNQARLVLAAKQNVTEKDLQMERQETLVSLRDLQLFQIHFYGYLQECLLQFMEN